MVRVLVIYDVSDNAKRSRLSKTLESMGLSRIQRSAFAGEIPAARIKDVERAASRIIDRGSDVVHIIPLAERDWAARRVLGTPVWGDQLARGLLVIA